MRSLQRRRGDGVLRQEAVGIAGNDLRLDAHRSGGLSQALRKLVEALCGLGDGDRARIVGVVLCREVRRQAFGEGEGFESGGRRVARSIFAGFVQAAVTKLREIANGEFQTVQSSSRAMTMRFCLASQDLDVSQTNTRCFEYFCAVKFTLESDAIVGRHAPGAPRVAPPIFSITSRRLVSGSRAGLRL